MTPEALSALHSKAFSATRAWSAAEFISLLKQRGTQVCGTADSFALIRVVVDEAEILTLATDPKMRRLGLAKAVLADAEAVAQNAGAQTMFLEVGEDNTAAKALYATCGYTQVGRRPGYYLPKDAAPIAALVMRKELKPA
jgi:ribosomal-protein-alanine N-acetyltransferase